MRGTLSFLICTCLYPSFLDVFLTWFFPFIYRGEPWHRLRSQDFSDIDLSGLSSTLLDLIFSLLSSNPSDRPAIEAVWAHDVVRRTRSVMRRNITAASRGRSSTGVDGDSGTAGENDNQDDKVALYRASAFGSEPPTFLAEILGEPELMDVSP